MKKMKLSAIVLGLAAAGAFAQAPAAAPAATPAPAAQPAAAAKPAAPATEAPKAEAAAQTATPAAEAPKADAAAQPAAPAAEAPKAEAAAQTAAPAAEAPKAEAAAQTAAPAAEAPKAEAAAQPAAPAAEAPKAEAAAQPAAPAAEAPKAEAAAQTAAPAAEAPKAEAAAQTAAPAAETTFLGLNITKADEAPAPTKAVEFKVSGTAEFDAYANMTMDDDKDLYHNYASTLDVDFEVKFNDNWSAKVQLEADGEGTSPLAYYNGAYVQYQNGENFSVKLGDLSFAEGGFNYYGYDDTGDYAVGITDHDIRGFELNLYGLQLGLGFARGADDDYCLGDICESGKSYDAHVAYQFDFAGQALRPFAHYKSWQEANANELYAGLEAALEFGPFAIHAVYGMQMDRLTEDEPKATHAVLAEPSFKVANVNVKGGFFYAFFDEDAPTVHGTDIPEYSFAYGEGSISFTDAFAIGLVGEYHTNSLDKDSDLGTVNFGARFYITPVDGLEITAFGMAILPVGDDWENASHSAFVSTEDYGEDMNLKFGVETVFNF